MDLLTPKTLKTSRGYTYAYNVSLSKTTPNLLFLHGFPDSNALWATQIPHFLSLGYGCIVPDCLGYGGTSKPSDPEAYNSEGMAADMIEILDAESVSKALVIGHDWGSFVAGRISLWHPERVLGAINMIVPYFPPSKVDLDDMLASTKAVFGYETYAYWKFFITPSASSIIDAHLPSFLAALFPADDSRFTALMGHQGALQEWVEADRIQDTKDFATDDMRKAYIARFKKDSFTGPLNYYKAFVGLHHWNHEKELPEPRHHFHTPTLYIGAKRDPIFPPVTVAAMKPYVEDLTVAEPIDSMHWVMREKPEELNAMIEVWLRKNFPTIPSH